MANYTYRDIALQNNMDLLITNEDLSVAEEPSALSRAISFRVITDPAEWRAAPAAMVGLRRFLGEINNDELKDRIRLDILKGLSFGSQISTGDLEIQLIDMEDNPNIIKISVILTDISYINLDNEETHNGSLKCFFNLDVTSGKLTFVDDLF